MPALTGEEGAPSTQDPGSVPPRDAAQKGAPTSQDIGSLPSADAAQQADGNDPRCIVKLRLGVTDAPTDLTYSEASHYTNCNPIG